MDECSLPKARPILCNESPAFQRHHMSLFCAAESPNRFPRVINTTSGEKTYIRWCCIDLLNSPGSSEASPPQVATHPAIHGRRADDRCCEGCTTLAFIAPQAALGRWGFRPVGDRRQPPG